MSVSAGNVVAVIAAGAAIIAVVVGWIQTSKTLRQNRELADLDAVRSVLDEAVVGLLDASTQITKVQKLKERPDSLMSVWAAADLAGKRISVDLERLKVRFGVAHPIVKSFEEAVVACSSVTSAVDRMIEHKGVGMDLRSNEERATQDAELAAWREEGAGIIERESEHFETERRRFLEAAHALAGAKLRASETA
ncbi:MAG TPA: hypothetical protein VFJ61_05065 [Solirubrobacterales bacterium]|nr:hypothetical protein [Solirubrobacterales bacterium]